MKNILLTFIICAGLSTESSLIQAAKNMHMVFCEGCGTAVVSDFLSICVSNSGGSQLLCKKCKRMKGRKEGEVTSPKSSSNTAASIGSDSVFDSSSSASPVSPLMSVLYAEIAKTRRKLKPSGSSFMVYGIDVDKAEAEAYSLILQRQQAGLSSKFSESHVYARYTASEEEDSFPSVVELLECLFEKPFPQPEKTYRVVFFGTKKYADITDPQGNEHRIMMDSSISFPFLWQSGGTFVYPNSTGITVRDFEKDRIDDFTFPIIPSEILKRKCPDLGFDKVEPISLHAEAERALQGHLATLPSPSFTIACGQDA